MKICAIGAMAQPGLNSDWAHCGISENGVLLMYMLEGVSNVETFISAYEESQ